MITKHHSNEFTVRSLQFAFGGLQQVALAGMFFHYGWPFHFGLPSSAGLR